MEFNDLTFSANNNKHVYGKYILKGWNINGFDTKSRPLNKAFKQTVIGSLYADFWVLTETHCNENEKVELDGFTVYQFNRANCKRGSGGVAIAINNIVLETHKVIGVHKGIDGQLGIKLKNNINDFLIGVLGLYLPPDSYLYGQDSELFFNSASVIWDTLSDCDLLVGSGDLNARTKDVNDYVSDIDGDVPPRQNPDKVKNSTGILTQNRFD